MNSTFTSKNPPFIILCLPLTLFIVLAFSFCLFHSLAYSFIHFDPAKICSCLKFQCQYLEFNVVDMPRSECECNSLRLTVLWVSSFGRSPLTFNYLIVEGNGANAVPHYQKLYSRVNRIWINRKGQPGRCAMARPRPGGTTFMIMVASEPGKYAVHFSFTSSCPTRQVILALALPQSKWHPISSTTPVSSI